MVVTSLALRKSSTLNLLLTENTGTWMLTVLSLAVNCSRWMEKMLPCFCTIWSISTWAASCRSRARFQRLEKVVERGTLFIFQKNAM